MTITIDVNDVREALDLTPMKEVISPDHRKAYNLAKDRLDEVFAVWALSDEVAAWNVLDSADFMEFAGRLNTIDDLDTAHNCSSIAALSRPSSSDLSAALMSIVPSARTPAAASASSCTVSIAAVLSRESDVVVTHDSRGRPRPFGRRPPGRLHQISGRVRQAR